MPCANIFLFLKESILSGGKMQTGIENVFLTWTMSSKTIKHGFWLENFQYSCEHWTFLTILNLLVYFSEQKCNESQNLHRWLMKMCMTSSLTGQWPPTILIWGLVLALNFMYMICNTYSHQQWICWCYFAIPTIWIPRKDIWAWQKRSLPNRHRENGDQWRFQVCTKRFILFYAKFVIKSALEAKASNPVIHSDNTT